MVCGFGLVCFTWLLVVYIGVVGFWFPFVNLVMIDFCLMFVGGDLILGVLV